MKYKRREAASVDAEVWNEVTYDREAGTNTQPIYHLDVGYYRTPDRDGQRICPKCDHIMHDHGWLETHNGGVVVCPGDVIVTECLGVKYLYANVVFESVYEPVCEKVDTPRDIAEYHWSPSMNGGTGSIEIVRTDGSRSKYPYPYSIEDKKCYRD